MAFCHYPIYELQEAQEKAVDSEDLGLCPWSQPGLPSASRLSERNPTGSGMLGKCCTPAGQGMTVGPTLQASHRAGRGSAAGSSDAVSCQAHMLGHSAAYAAGQGCWAFSTSLYSCLLSRGGGLEVGPTAALAFRLIRRVSCPALEAVARDAFFVVEHLDPTLGHES